MDYVIVNSLHKGTIRITKTIIIIMDKNTGTNMYQNQ